MTFKPPQPLSDQWRWRLASFAPTEGLLSAPILIGVCRALANAQEGSGRKRQLRYELKELQLLLDQGDPDAPNLARTPNRDLLRNSGQYWTALGLTTKVSGSYELTDYGRRLAAGEIGTPEFIHHCINRLVVPNPLLEDPERILAIHEAGCRGCRPLLFLLEMLGRLERDGDAAYLTCDEFLRVVVPATGANKDAKEVADLLLSLRRNDVNVSEAPLRMHPNEQRSAKEFPRLLAGFGMLYPQGRGRTLCWTLNAEWSPTQTSTLCASTAKGLGSPGTDLEIPPDSIQRSRYRVTRQIARPRQAVFRQRVLSFGGYKCLLTGDTAVAALEAAHIRAVEHGGPDEHSNGLVLRTDIHRLFDSGLIRIDHAGYVHIAPVVANSPGYRNLPKRVEIPHYINLDQLKFRMLTNS